MLANIKGFVTRLYRQENTKRKWTDSDVREFTSTHAFKANQINLDRGKRKGGGNRCPIHCSMSGLVMMTLDGVHLWQTQHIYIYDQQLTIISTMLKKGFN